MLRGLAYGVDIVCLQSLFVHIGLLQSPFPGLHVLVGLYVLLHLPETQVPQLLEYGDGLLRAIRHHVPCLLAAGLHPVAALYETVSHASIQGGLIFLPGQLLDLVVGAAWVAGDACQAVALQHGQHIAAVLVLPLALG